MDKLKVKLPSADKYDNKPLRFKDCESHYELIFADIFRMPDKDYTASTDVFVDLKEADKNKELHIYINSYGGEVACLTMLMQPILEFKHRVTISSGSAMSAGFVLFACGTERYVNPFHTFMYHASSSFAGGKGLEIKKLGEFIQKEYEAIIEVSGLKDILTKKELELGETSEVWLMGSELIERGSAKDYSEFSKRSSPNKVDFFSKNDRYFRLEDNEFIEYKATENKLSYSELYTLKDNKKKD